MFSPKETKFIILLCDSEPDPVISFVDSDSGFPAGWLSPLKMHIEFRCLASFSASHNNLLESYRILVSSLSKCLVSFAHFLFLAEWVGACFLLGNNGLLGNELPLPWLLTVSTLSILDKQDTKKNNYWTFPRKGRTVIQIFLHLKNGLSDILGL